MRGLSFLTHEGQVGSPTCRGSSKRRTTTALYRARAKKESGKTPRSLFCSEYKLAILLLRGFYVAPRLLPRVASTPPAQGPYSQSPPIGGLLTCLCLRRSTLTRRGTPLVPLAAWRVASPTPRLNTKAGFINSMSYSLPKYYFQDIHPDVMDEIMHGMQEALPEPSWRKLTTG